MTAPAFSLYRTGCPPPLERKVITCPAITLDCGTLCCRFLLLPFIPDRAMFPYERCHPQFTTNKQVPVPAFVPYHECSRFCLLDFHPYPITTIERI